MLVVPFSLHTRVTRGVWMLVCEQLVVGAEQAAASAAQPEFSTESICVTGFSISALLSFETLKSVADSRWTGL